MSDSEKSGNLSLVNQVARALDPVAFSDEALADGGGGYEYQRNHALAQASVAVGVVQEAIEGLVERELDRYRREIQTAEMWPGNDPNFDWEHVRVPHLRSAGDAMSRVYVLREALAVLSQGEEQ